MTTNSICQKSAAYKTAACIDIHCEIQAVPFKQLSEMQPGEPSAAIRERVIDARKIQEERFKPFKGIHCNAMMTERMLHEFAEPDAESLDMLRIAVRTRTVKLGNKSFHLEQEIFDIDTQEVKSRCLSILVLYDLEQKQSISFSDEWRKAISDYDGL